MRAKLPLFFLVISVSIILGVIIFLEFFNSENSQSTKTGLSIQKSFQTTPLPTPTPPQKPVIDQNSNLQEELKKLNPDDYLGDFKSLQDSF